MHEAVRLAASLLAALALSVCAGRSRPRPQTIRVGFFPNVTHAQALVGLARGTFQAALGRGTVIDAKAFNAGPSVIEALFAGELDLAYVGPSPAINGFVRSRGDALRIVAGATSGGAALVVRRDSGIAKVSDLHGKRLASPQLGNTQDVALRGWLRDQGLGLREQGGDVTVVPVSNPDQLLLFRKKEIDGAWAPEPWASRLVREGGGRVFLDERSLWPRGEFVTAHVIVSRRFLAEHPGAVKSWLSAHVELTDWINRHLPEAKRVLNAELLRLTGKRLADEVMDDAFSRLKVTCDPVRGSLLVSARRAFAQGFLGKELPDLSGIYDLAILDEVLKEKGKPPLGR